MRSDNETRLVELGRDECLRLLAGASFGRVAVNSPGWPPLIRPVIYVFDEPSQSVVFRSAEGSKLTSLLRSERAAFEVDEIDPADRLGWSVIVIGPAEEITSGHELDRLRRLSLQPHAAGELPHCMRIRATVVSGRRLVRVPPDAG
jgi:nitroimidazol reductase NimA-like FMN-containing flavoprotein (pyridoxamine 5'-phosphate oxidase superfamily)